MTSRRFRKLSSGQWLDADKILLREDYPLPESIHPLETAPAVPKSLYEADKGDDRDNSGSARKLKLGRAWVAKAGNAFRYFMVFDGKEVEGAYRLEELLKVVGGL